MTGQEDKSLKLAKMVKQVDESNISSIKNVVSGIIKIINDPDSTAKDLKEIIEIDPPLTGKMLRIANSAYYSPRTRIGDIEEAVIWLGFDAVKELALNQKVCEIFDDKSVHNGFSRIALWKHSLAVALMGKLIYRREFGQRGEKAYTAGLLHDIGIIAEHQFAKDEFNQALDKQKSEEKNLSEAEKEVLGYNHTQLGRAITAHWNFPNDLIMPIGFHHNPEAGLSEYHRITATLYISDCICQDRAIGFSDMIRTDKSLFRKCTRKLNLEPFALDVIVNEVEQEIQKMESEGLFD